MDPIAQVTTADIQDGSMIVFINGQPVVTDIQTIINNYTTGGAGVFYIPFGSEAIDGLAYAH